MTNPVSQTLNYSITCSNPASLALLIQPTHKSLTYEYMRFRGYCGEIESAAARNLGKEKKFYLMPGGLRGGVSRVRYTNKKKVSLFYRVEAS